MFFMFTPPPGALKSGQFPTVISCLCGISHIARYPASSTFCVSSTFRSNILSLKMRKSGVRRLWGYPRLLLSRQRYHGVTDDHQDSQTELGEIRAQPSAFSVSSLSSFSTIPQESPPSIPESAPVAENDTLPDLRVGDEETTAGTRPGIVGPTSRPRKTAWIDGVYLCARAGAFILLMNLVLIAIAAGLASRYPENGSYSTTAVIYQGSCGLTKRWNTALHLIINVLSTCILAASNYCMQTLVAPTREEVDAHHAQRKSLDVGSASVKNLLVIGRGRLALWVVLMLTATPFHLMYVRYNRSMNQPTRC